MNKAIKTALRATFYAFLSLTLSASFLTAMGRSAGAVTINQRWMSQYTPNPAANSNVAKMVRDQADNLYVAGYTIEPSIDYNYSLVKYDSDGNQQWSASYDNGVIDQINDIAVDTTGNVYVTGNSRSSNAPYDDFATIKYNSNGAQQWVSRYEGLGQQNDTARALRIDTAGNIYVTGESWNGTFTGIAIVKYDANGNQQWASFTSVGNNNRVSGLWLDSAQNAYIAATGNGGDPAGEVGLLIAYDANGNQLWTNQYNYSDADYYYASTLDSAGNSYVVGLSATGSDQNYLVAKIDANGNRLWSNVYDAGALDGAKAVTVDNAGNVYVTGTTFGSTASSPDIVTIKYNASGTQQWASRYNHQAHDQGDVIQVDSTGNVYVGGSSYTNPTSYDYVIIKYSPTGSELWNKRLNNGGSDILRALTLGSHGGVYVSGDSCDVNFQTCKFTTAEYNEEPSPPTGLTAPSPTGSSPNLGWDAVTGATSYKIYRQGVHIGTSTIANFTDTTANEGSNTYHVTALSRGGEGQPSNTINVVVDRTAPVIAATVTPTPNAAGWNKTNLTVGFSCSDAHSGIASCSSPVTITGDTAGQTITGSAVDQVGRTASTTAVVKLDKTLPTVSGLTLSPTFILFAGTMNIAANASDALSGITTGEYYIDTDPGRGQGTPMTYSSSTGKIAASRNFTFGSISRGQHRVYVRTLDVAGNWSTTISATFIYL